MVPSITNMSSIVPPVYSSLINTTYDPLSWKGRIVVKQAGKEARSWFKISRPLARPADPFPLTHDDYDFSHARERVTCSAVGKSISAAITRQVSMFALCNSYMLATFTLYIFIFYTCTHTYIYSKFVALSFSSPYYLHL